MTEADVQLMQLIYIISALGMVLFTSMLCRWLWRPLRFLLLATVFGLFFTPYFMEQSMPDGGTQNVVPAFVVVIYDVANDRDHWQEGIKRAGTAIAVVSAALGVISLLLATVLPKRAKLTPPSKTEQAQPKTAKRHSKHNPYLPEDFQESV
jgi:energy-coupling factor transporter transmembrane protein EcfT